MEFGAGKSSQQPTPFLTPEPLPVMECAILINYGKRKYKSRMRLD